MAEHKDNVFDIEEALLNIDLEFRNYIPSADAIDFFNIMRLVNGADFEFDSPLVHYWIVDLLFGNVTRENYPYSKEVQDKININNKRIAIMMSRGLGKSSVITAFLPVYCAVKGEVPNYGPIYFILAVGASAQGGGRVMALALRSMCEDSEFCKSYFESMRFTETEAEWVRKPTRPNEKLDKRVFLLRTMGASSGNIRGVRSNHGAHRPDWILFDDIIPNMAAAYSETIMGNLEDMINADAINALKGGGKGKIINVFTPFHLQDPNVKTLLDGSYTPVAIPICEHIDENTTEKEFRGAWVEMHPYEAVREQYLQAVKSNTTRAFNQERMLKMANEEDRMVPDNLIQVYNRENIMQNLGAYTLYITTDFTTTSEAKSDFSGLMVWAVSHNADYFLLDVCVRRQGIQEQYNELFRMLQTWGRYGNHIEVGIEVDGQQKAHVFALKEMMQKRNQYFSFARQKGAPITREGILSKGTGTNKHERFRYMLPQFQNKKMWFPQQLADTPDMQETMKQLKYTTYSGFAGHDDAIDCISQLGMIDVRLPSEQVSGEFGDEEAIDSIWARFNHDEDHGSGCSTVF